MRAPLSPTVLRRVFLIPSHDMTWAGLRSELRHMAGVQLVGEARHPDQALPAIVELQPDVILLSNEPVDRDLLTLCTTLRTHAPVSRIIVLADRLDEAQAQLLPALLQAGIAGYLLYSDLTPASFAPCLAVVVGSDVLIGSRQAADSLVAALQNGLPNVPSVPLSEREWLTLSHLAAGLMPEQIAVAEGLSARTVERLIAELKLKLDAPSSYLLGMKAAALGIRPS